MAKHLAASASGWIAAGLLLMTSSASPAAERLVVRTYNNFGVPPGELAIARAATSAILSDAGLQTIWRDCSAGCDDEPGPREVVVRIVTAPKAVAPESLGCSVIDLREATGTLATVYADRIERVAHRAGVDVGTLLGRAVAHEIGHMLLGTADHAPAGLMRSRWADRELQRDLADDWRLSPEEAAQLDRGLVARALRARSTPDAIVASVEGLRRK